MKNPALSADEARKLKFPRLMEVWDGTRHSSPIIIVIDSITASGRFFSCAGNTWQNAAEPPADLIEAMREQFAFKPKRMLVWDNNEDNAKERIVIADLGSRAVSNRYITVRNIDEDKYENGYPYDWAFFRNAKPLPETKTDPVADEIADLKRRLAELESKHGKP